MLTNMLAFIEQNAAAIVNYLTLFAAMLGVGAAVYSLGSARRTKFSHKIAVIGFPRSGKTTLISTMFGKLISTEISRQIRVSGEETIARVSENYKRILDGKHLAQTTDDDVFLFRFQYVRRAFSRLFFRTYDVEIADFPGEYSSSLDRKKRLRDLVVDETSDDAIEALELSLQEVLPVDDQRAGSKNHVGIYDQQFQSWVSQADEYIVVLDVLDVINNPETASKIQGQMVRAILQLKESSIEGSGELFNKDVCLVFTKCDAIFSELRFTPDYFETANYNSAQSIKEDSGEFFENRKQEALDTIAPTLSLLKSNFRHVSIVFHSSYLENAYFDRAQRQLIQFVLPGHVSNQRPLGQMVRFS